MSGMTLAMLMQFCVMSHQDIYTYTLPNVNTVQCGRYFTEHNKVLDGFEKSGLEDVYFVGSGVLVGVVSEKVGDVGGRLLLAGLTLMEINAIHSWGKWGVGPREVEWEFGRFEI